MQKFYNNHGVAAVLKFFFFTLHLYKYSHLLPATRFVLDVGSGILITGIMQSFAFQNKPEIRFDNFIQMYKHNGV